ncbi:MAG: hypothetical protein IT382_23970 [Deltaproteobacteria bacterium]|nr:hypothetical protein [Deltaproteobacteria bacterium]
MHAVAVLTIALAAAPQAAAQLAPQIAVVELSAHPSPALAEAMRALPELKGRCMSAQQTQLIVSDAASLGLSCAFSDDACLQKLVVLARLDELLALDADAEEVRIASVSARAVRRANAGVAGSAAARARAAWGALRRGDAAPRVIDSATPPEPAVLSDDESPRPSARAVTQDPAETPTASSGGVTLPLVLGMGGAAATLVLGAGAVGVSAALAQQLRGTQRGIPLDDSYDTLQLAFWSLTALTAASAVTGAVGLGLFLAEEPDTLSAP